MKRRKLLDNFVEFGSQSKRGDKGRMASKEVVDCSPWHGLRRPNGKAKKGTRPGART